MMDSWGVGDVSMFLLEVGLEMHVGEFRTHQIDGLALLKLDNAGMIDLDMYDMSARGYLRQCIKEHKDRAAASTTAFAGSGGGGGGDAAVEGVVANKVVVGDDLGSAAVETLVDLFPDIARSTIERVLAVSGSTFDATTALCSVDVRVDQTVREMVNAEQKQKRVRSVQHVENASDVYFDVDPNDCATPSSSAGLVVASSAHAAVRVDGEFGVLPTLSQTRTPPLSSTSSLTTLSSTRRAAATEMGPEARSRRGSTSALLREMLDVLDDIVDDKEPDEVHDLVEGVGIGTAKPNDPYHRTQELFPELDPELIKTELDRHGEQGAIEALMKAIEVPVEDVDNTAIALPTTTVDALDAPSRAAVCGTPVEPADQNEHSTHAPDAARMLSPPLTVSSPALRQRSQHVLTRLGRGDGRGERPSGGLKIPPVDGARHQSIASRPRLLSTLLDADKQRARTVVGGAASRASAEAVDRDEFKRREAISELTESEAMFQKDLHALHILIVAPMEKESAEAAGSVDPDLPPEAVAAMGRCVRALRESGTQFLAELRQAGADYSGDYSGDVARTWVVKLKERFLSYCNTCYHLQQCFQRQTPAFAAMIQRTSTDPLARGLPLSAFVLAPIQRVARYPMLLQAIVDRHASRATEIVLLKSVQAQYVDITVTCNNRLRSLESIDVVKQIELELDRSLIDAPIVLTEVSPDGERRALVKRATLDIVKLNEKGRVLKQRPMEFILFTDMLMYGKPLKPQKQGDLTMQVYKEVHLTSVASIDVLIYSRPTSFHPPPSLFLALPSKVYTAPVHHSPTPSQLCLFSYVECQSLDVTLAKTPDRRRKNKSLKGGSEDGKDDAKSIFQVVTYYEEGKAEKLHVRAQSATDARRWVDALNPTSTQTTWTKQRARATQDYEPRDMDELVLRVGDIIHITHDADDQRVFKGTRVQEVMKSKRKREGWFHSSMVMLLPSLHEDGKARKRLNSEPKNMY